MIRRCRELLVTLAGAGHDWAAVLFAGSGTAAVEAVVASVVPPERGLLVVDNGVYGDRIARMARAHSIPATSIARWRTAPSSPTSPSSITRPPAGS